MGMNAELAGLNWIWILVDFLPSSLVADLRWQHFSLILKKELQPLVCYIFQLCSRPELHWISLGAKAQKPRPQIKEKHSPPSNGNGLINQNKETIDVKSLTRISSVLSPRGCQPSSTSCIGTGLQGGHKSLKWYQKTWYLNSQVILSNLVF